MISKTKCVKNTGALRPGNSELLFFFVFFYFFHYCRQANFRHLLAMTSRQCRYIVVYLILRSIHHREVDEGRRRVLLWEDRVLACNEEKIETIHLAFSGN